MLKLSSCASRFYHSLANKNPIIMVSLAYVGKWYEQYRYFALVEVGVSCAYAVYEQNKDDASKIDVLNSGYNKWTKMWSSIRGTATPDKNRCNNEAKLTVTFPTFVGNSAGIYWVLDTDYKKYSIVWSCKEYVFIHRNYLWIITRDQFPDETIIEKAKNTINSLGLSATALQKTDQTECGVEAKNTENSSA